MEIFRSTHMLGSINNVKIIIVDIFGRLSNTFINQLHVRKFASKICDIFRVQLFSCMYMNACTCNILSTIQAASEQTEFRGLISPPRRKEPLITLGSHQEMGTGRGGRDGGGGLISGRHGGVVAAVYSSIDLRVPTVCRLVVYRWSLSCVRCCCL